MDPVLEMPVLEKERISGKLDRSFTIKESGNVEITAAECQKLCKKIGLKYFEGYENRVRQFKFTDATVDRYGDRIVAKGVNLDKYKSNPIVLGFHNSWNPPIGSSIKVWYDKESDSIKGWVLFFDDKIDNTGLAETMFRMVDTGAIKTGSIGFIPVPGKVRAPTEEEKATYGMGQWGYIYEEIELLEYSIVPLPANPSAMMEPISKGFVSEKAMNMMIEKGAFPAEQMKDLIAAWEKHIQTKGKAMDPVIPAPVVSPEKTGSAVNIDLYCRSVTEIDSSQIEALKAKGFNVNIKIGTAQVQNQIINVEDLAEMIHVKAGAVLSKKNKTLVKNTVSVLTNSLEALKELLKAAGETDEDPAEEDNEDNEDENDEPNSDNGKKKPKGKEVAQPVPPSGGNKGANPDPYGADFLGLLEKGSKSLKEHA